MNTTFLQELEKMKKPVWKLIQSYLPTNSPREHYQMVRDYPQRQGKYFRPGLLLLATELFGGKKREALLTAAAMQVSEDWLLIHDDIEDHSLERRSKPTLNELHGYELALNAGDALHVLMWKMLGDNVKTLGQAKGWKVYEKFTDILLTTIEGQFEELHWNRKHKFNVTEKDYLAMAEKKAGYYTVIGPLQLGAIVAGNYSPTELGQIKEWGTPFGLAFQIWDDVLNLTLKAKITGKDSYSDIVESKRTLVFIHALRKCSRREKVRLEAIYKKPGSKKTPTDKTWVLKLFQTTGSLAYAQDRARELAREAENKFLSHSNKLPSSTARQTIRQAIHFVVERSK